MVGVPPSSGVELAKGLAGVQRRITRLAYSTVLLTGLHGGWIGPLLPSIARAQGFALERVGLLVSAIFVGFLLTVLVGGEIVDRWGGRVALTLAAALMGAGLLGLATLPGLPALLGSALVIGLGTGISDVAAHVIVAAFNRGRVATALNYLNVSFGVGALLGPLIAGVAIRNGLPYQVVFRAGAVVAALVAILLVTTPLSHERAAATGAESKGALLMRPVLWVLGGVLLLYIGVETGLGAWLSSYLRATGDLSESRAAWVVSLFWIGLVGGRMLSGRLAERVATRWLTLGAVALAVAALAVLAVAPAQIVLHAPAVLLIGLGLGPVFPNVIATGAALFPHQVSTMTVTVIAVGSIGGIIGPWLLGHTLVLVGPRPAMALAFGTTLAMLGLFWVAGQLPGEPVPPAARQGQPDREAN